MMRRLPLVLLLALATAGCGLRPLYADGTRGGVAQALSSVMVGPIPDRAGWLVRSALVDRIGSGTNPQYRLEVELDDDIASYGIRGDAAATRERRTLRARYRLVSTATGETLLDATAGSDAGIDVVSSEYATIAAEDSATERLATVLADQIVARLGLFMRRGGAAPASR
jgi:LPS-assembly lipoprotein